jgi:HD-like signal output (HDOD) protein
MLHRMAELQAFGTTHAEVGTYLLWSWALPDSITEVVLRHHQFPADPARVSSPAVAVHIANALVNGGLDEAEVAWLKAFGMEDELAGWQQLSEGVVPVRLGRYA